MYLSVFYEFCQPKMLEDIHYLYPNLRIDHPQTSLKDKYISSELSKIYRTNVKLFYTKDDNIQDVIDDLELLGFKIIDRNPFTIYKEKRTLLIDNIKYKLCECRKNNIEINDKIEKIVIVDVKHYFNDRIIIEVPDIS